MLVLGMLLGNTIKGVKSCLEDVVFLFKGFSLKGKKLIILECPPGEQLTKVFFSLRNVKVYVVSMSRVRYNNYVNLIIFVAIKF